MNMNLEPNDENYLEHHQIKGAKWGHRRWQNEDGSLTPEGRIHYGVGPPRTAKNEQNNPKSSNIHIAKNYKELFSADFKGKKKDLDLNDVKKALSGLKEQAVKISEDRKAKAVEKEKARAEEGERAAKEAEGKRLAEEKIRQEAELARQRSEADALKEYYVNHPLKIFEARKVLSKEDIKDVEDKILFERELKDFRRDELLRYVRTAKDVGDAVGNVYKGLDNLKNLYNLGADTYNAFVAAKDPNDEKRPMRKIGDGKNMKDTSQKKKQNDQSGNQQQNQDKQKNQNASEQKNNTQKQKQEPEQPKKKQDKPEYYEKIGDRYFYSKEEVNAYKENQKKQKAFYNDKAAQKEVQDFAQKFYRQYSASSADKRDEFRAMLNAKVRSIPTDERSPKDRAKVQAIYDIIESIEKKEKNEK